MNRRRLRVRAETWDGVTNEQILERDRWRCGICRKAIGKSFKYPHPRSKSVDHIVPLSQGGDDTAANKRAAHLGCNNGRMNRGGNEQLALIG
jgi:5-methylcytosine-specific restriction endonuclease McrA